MKFVCAGTLLVALGAAVIPLFGQEIPLPRAESTGPTDWTESPIRPEISGFVKYRDSKEAPLSISVRLQTATGVLLRETRTGKLGEFSFPVVACGNYVVAVDASGYRPVRIPVEQSFIPSEPVRINLVPAQSEPFTGTDQSSEPRPASVPEKARKEYEKGLHELSRKNVAQSLDHFHKAVEVYPNYDIAYLHLGWVYLQQRDFPHAGAAIKRAIQLNPSSSTAHELLGSLKRQQNQSAEAVQEFETSLRLEEASWRAHQDLGEIFLKLGRVDQAYSHIVRAHQLNPAPASIHLDLYNALILRDDYARAAVELDEFLQLYPNHTLAAKVRQQRQALRAKLDKTQR